MSRRSHLDLAAITDRLQRELAQVDGDLQLAEQGVATATLDHGCVASLSPMLGMQQQAVTHASVQRLKTQQRWPAPSIRRRCRAPD